LSNSDSLLDHGIVDSMGVMELVTFLETQYGIAISDQELVPENLDSIEKLMKFLERKLPPSR
jgi:acyl carrier protein